MLFDMSHKILDSLGFRLVNDKLVRLFHIVVDLFGEL